MKERHHCSAAAFSFFSISHAHTVIAVNIPPMKKKSILVPVRMAVAISSTAQMHAMTVMIVSAFLPVILLIKFFMMDTSLDFVVVSNLTLLFYYLKA